MGRSEFFSTFPLVMKYFGIMVPIFFEANKIDKITKTKLLNGVYRKDNGKIGEAGQEE
jgi:hypothetical protein